VSIDATRSTGVDYLLSPLFQPGKEIIERNRFGLRFAWIEVEPSDDTRLPS